MNDIGVLSYMLDGADKRKAAEVAANRPVVDAIALANAAYQGSGSVITGIASLNFAARGILGEQLYYCPVAIVFLKDATSLPRETLVSMRTIFDKDPEARKDMKVFLQHLKAGDVEQAQDVRDTPSAGNSEAADQDLTDSHTILVTLTKATRAAIASPAPSEGSIAIPSLARGILGTAFSISPLAQRILRSQKLSKEAIVMMK